MTQSTQQLNRLNNSNTILNALSVDVEEYYHATIFQEATAHLKTVTFPSRVEAQIDLLLALLTQSNVRATFFILGAVADKHPRMVRDIAAAGHEIACHGFAHDLVHSLTPAVFREDVHRAKAVIEDVASRAVLGYRAPSFSIPSQGAWAYEILSELGFWYDSSVYPIVHDHYGQPHAPRVAYVVWQGSDRRLIEVPIGTVRLLGVNLPIGGGGYFRLLPGTLLQRGIARVNRRERKPIVFYIHPWELDWHLPRPPMRWHQRFRHYVGLRSMEKKLSRLLATIRFAPIRDVLADDDTFAGASVPQ